MGGTRMESRIEELDKEFHEFKETLVEVVNRSIEQEKKSGELEGTLKKFMEEMRTVVAQAQKGSEKPRSEPEVAQREPEVMEVGENNLRPRTLEKTLENAALRREIDDGGRRELGLGFRRLDFPPFNGSEPLNWVPKVERYFLLNAVTEAEKVA